MEFRKADGSPRLVDYSIHPSSRLGLHNALLSYNDRIEILQALGGTYECEVYVVDGINVQLLTQELAIKMFNNLPAGEVKWTTICEFLLPQSQEAQPVPEETLHESQLHLFEYAHVPVDTAETPHKLDVDA
jgi:hypothetical protein